MNKSILRMVLCFALACNLMLTTVTASNFGQSTDDIVDLLGSNWDTEKIKNPPNPDEDGGTWTSSVTGDDGMKWLHDHQMEYYFDQLYNTTAPYIWGESAAGLGILGVAGSGANIVETAANQVGIVEGTFCAHCGATENVTTYGDYVGCHGLPWCCAFVVWCAAQHGLQADDDNENGIFKITGSCETLYRDMRARGFTEIMTMKALLPGGVIDTVKPGDILFFADGSGVMHHIGIIENAGVTEDGEPYIDTIEGNSNNQVARRRYYAKSTGDTAQMALRGAIVRPAYPITQETGETEDAE